MTYVAAAHALCNVVADTNIVRKLVVLHLDFGAAWSTENTALLAGPFQQRVMSFDLPAFYRRHIGAQAVHCSKTQNTNRKQRDGVDDEDSEEQSQHPLRRSEILMCPRQILVTAAHIQTYVCSVAVSPEQVATLKEVLLQIEHCYNAPCEEAGKVRNGTMADAVDRPWAVVVHLQYAS